MADELEDVLLGFTMLVDEGDSLTVTFIAVNATNVMTRWRFGDNTVEQEVEGIEVTHTFAADGEYLVECFDGWKTESSSRYLLVEAPEVGLLRVGSDETDEESPPATSMM